MVWTLLVSNFAIFTPFTETKSAYLQENSSYTMRYIHHFIGLYMLKRAEQTIDHQTLGVVEAAVSMLDILESGVTPLQCLLCTVGALS